MGKFNPWIRSSNTQCSRSFGYGGPCKIPDKGVLLLLATAVCSSSRSLSSAACPLFIDVEIHQFPRVPQVEILAGKTPEWIKSGLCSTVKEMHSPLSPHQLHFYKP
ncbi:uncharacterized protein B0T23DRAFT_140429 [Neurospora hispaniola]|uniref:Uncharacterized protein n=1 Tax=Neurospora hispaniola TaxID=588809 RepID=A0AAJ0I7M5_9PEZI|nr:hypothetical protein B0T23DRAFT_140429 [Neurospora hispaniola]